jgi:hypothetical protein
MAARKSKLTQYKVRAQFGAGGVDQLVLFTWARSEKQALRTVRGIAPRVDVVEVRPIDKLVADPGHATEHATGGAAVGRAVFSDRP